MKKMKKYYNPKIETVKYLELIDQNKNCLFLKTASNCAKFPEHASSHSIFNTFFLPNFRFIMFRN